jgi:thioredoxin 1
MSKTTNKKKFPWLQAGVIALILIIISGIYVFKNSPPSGQDEPITQSETQTPIDETGVTNPDSQNSQNPIGALPKLVDLGSNTCIPCREMAPILAELKQEYNGRLTVEVVDVYEEQEKTMAYNEKHAITVIPTQILFDASGNEVWSHEGFIPKEELIQIFREKVGVK